jgi:methyl coenzyme M reductase subunit D
MKYLNSLSPYKFWIVGGAILAIVLYVGWLNMRVTHFKNKADELRIEVKNWQFSYKNLSEAAEKQNTAIKDMAKIGEDMRQLGQRLLKEAQQSNTIRQPKINAATARFNPLNKTDCASAITDAKKELTP